MNYGEAGVVKVAYRQARWEAAKAWLKVHDDVDVVGITGSVGKTTTKEIIGQVLSGQFESTITKANYDPIFNIPLTALSIRDEEKFVAEMGVDGCGQMDQYLDLMTPRVGVITKFSLAHADKDHLGSLEGLVEEKSKLIKALPPHGWAILNGDDELVRQLGNGTKASVMLVGFDKNNDLRITDYKLVKGDLPKSCFTVNYGFGEKIFEIGLLGRHNVFLTTIGVGVGMVMGMSLDTIKERVDELKPVKGRLYPEYIKGRLVIDDTYNASPEAVKAAIDVLVELDSKNGTLVLGDMLELGELSDKEHRQVGRYAFERGVRRLGVYGDEAKLTAREFKTMGGEVMVAESHEELSGWIRDTESEVILVKGSRGMMMERVIEGLR